MLKGDATCLEDRDFTLRKKYWRYEKISPFVSLGSLVPFVLLVPLVFLGFLVSVSFRLSITSFPSSYSSCVSPSLFILSVSSPSLSHLPLLICLFLSSREDWTAFYSKEAPTSSDYTLIRFVPHTVEAVHYDLKINPGNNWRPFTLVKSPDESKWRRE